MSEVHVPVVAKLDDAALNRAVNAMNERFQTGGRDAGKSWGNDFARGVKRGTDDVNKAIKSTTQETNRLRQAEQNYQKALRTGDREAVIRETQKLTKAYRDAATEQDRLSTATRNLDSVMRTGQMAPAVAAESFMKMARSGPGAALAVTTVAAAVSQLAGIATSAAQSLWALPGVIGAVGSAFATVKLATAGLDDVFTNMGDPEKFAESLRKVAPSAQDFALSIKGMMPALKNLQQETQQAFFQGTGPMLTGLADQFLPEIKQLTTGIAGAMNQAFSGVAAQLMTPQTQGSIHEFIANTVQAFQNLGPALAPLSGALADLMAAGSGVMPELASAATDAATAFASFIREARASGELDDWIREGMQTLGQLGDIIWDIGKIMADLIPVGQQALPALVELFDDIATVTPYVVEGISAIGPALEVVGEATRMAQGDFSGLTDVVAAFGDFAVSTFAKVRDVLNTMFDPIRTGIDLFNKIPGVADIPQIPDFASGRPAAAPSMSRSALDRQHGLDYQSQALFDNPTGNIPGAAPRPDPFWGTPTPGRWGNGGPVANAQRQFQDFIDGASGGSSGKTPEGLVPNADQLKRTLERMFPGIQVNADVHRQDSYGEHSSGEALDIMVGNNRNLGEQINRWLLQNADVLGLQYNLWRQAQWDPSGTITPMENRGSPTANHQDHIHARVSPGASASGNVMPLGSHSYQSGVSGLSDPLGTGPTPVSVQSFSQEATGSLFKGLGLDSDLGASRGLAGLIENAIKAIGMLAIAPLAAYNQATGNTGGSGGLIGISQRASAPSFSGGQSFGPSFGGPSFTPGPSAGSGGGLASLFTPSAGSPFPGAPGVPGGQSPFPGPAGIPGGPSAQPLSYAPPQQGGGWQPAGGGQFGIGGIAGAGLGAAKAAGGAAINGLAPGAGMAAQAGMELMQELAERSISYAAQMGGIAVQGVEETLFQVGGSSFSDGWAGRLLGAAAGAGFSLPNSAGNTQPAMQAKDGGKAGLEAMQQQMSNTTNSNNTTTWNVHAKEQQTAREIASELAYKSALSGVR